MIDLNAILARLDLTKNDAAFLLDVNRATIRRWSADPAAIPRATAVLLQRCCDDPETMQALRHVALAQP